MLEALYPEWPTPGKYLSRERAIVAAMSDAEDGCRIVIHQPVCACCWDFDCDCSPDVLVVREGRA